MFTKLFPWEAFEYLHQRLGVISTPKWMLLNACLICLRFTQEITIKRKVQVGGLVSGRVQSEGVSARTVQLGGAAPDGKIPLPLMKKGERFIRCRGQRHGSRRRIFIICRGQRHGSRGSMSDMISLLHQSVAINAKGGDCWLRLVFIDVNPWRNPHSTKVG